LWGYFTSNHGLFKMTGSFFNPGPFAGYLAAVFPVSLGFYLFYDSVSIPIQHPFILKLNSLGTTITTFLKRILFIFSLFYHNSKVGVTSAKLAEGLRHILDSIIKSLILISIIVMCLVLPASRSRAAWLAVLVSSGYLLSVRYQLLSQIRSIFHTRIKQFFLISSLIIAITAIGAGLYYFKQGSADGRLLIWKVSTEMIKDKPILGHGADKFAADYMNYQADYFKHNPDELEAMQADNVTYAYNEFLKITVEKGLIGLLLALALIGCLFFVKTDSQKSNNSLSLLVARGSLLSIIVFALFSYPSEILPIKVLFVLFIAIVANRQNPIHLFQSGKKETALRYTQNIVFANKVVLFAVLAIGFITFYPAGKYIRQQYQAYKTWKDASDIYSSGAYPECLEDFVLAYPYLKSNGVFLVQYGKALEMAGKNDSSILILDEAKQYLNNTILYTCMGNNYKALDKHTEAEQAYQHAQNMAPARFYPLYLLAKLYNETGKTEKAVEMAKKVMGKEVKIKSTAISQIREEMRNIVEKQDITQNMSNLKEKGRKHNYPVATASCPAPFLKKKVR
jgi:O-antigen polymerase